MSERLSSWFSGGLNFLKAKRKQILKPFILPSFDFSVLTTQSSGARRSSRFGRTEEAYSYPGSGGISHTFITVFFFFKVVLGLETFRHFMTSLDRGRPGLKLHHRCSNGVGLLSLFLGGNFCSFHSAARNFLFGFTKLVCSFFFFSRLTPRCRRRSFFFVFCFLPAFQYL